MRAISSAGFARGVDHAISTLAGRQHGVVTREQLLDLGLSSGAIGRRLSSGRLHRLYRGVYLVGHKVPPPYAREMAAVFACAPDALVSHASAGALWKLTPPTSPSAPVIVTVIGRALRQPRIDIRRTRNLHPADRRSLKSIPITGPARTIIDMAPGLTRPELEQVCAKGKRHHLVSRTQLEDALERNRGRPGVPPVSALLAKVDPAYTRSEAERRMLALLRAAGLPEPLTNARLGDYEPDFYWPNQRLIVEVDGYDFHSDPVAFEGDRKRDAEFLSIGIRTSRITWKQLTRDARGVASRLEAALDAHPG